jgi:hypothetical protein
MTIGVGRRDAWTRREQPSQTAYRRRFACVAALVICVAGSLASPAILVAATPAAEAENLIRDGVALRRQKHDEQALPLFQKAYDLVRNPRTAGQLGLCELGVGYSIDAEQHIREALAAPEHPWVAKNKSSLDEALKRARQNIGEVTVTGAPVGAEVYVNGHSVGRLPLHDPIRLVRGVADIELRAPGYVTSRRSLGVTAATQSVDLKLEHERVAPVAPVTKPPEPIALAPISGSPAEPSGDEPSHATPPEPTAPRGRALKWAGLATGVLAAGALVVAGVETMRWQSGITDFNNYGVEADPSTRCLVVSPTRGAPGCEALYNKYTSAERLAIIGYAAGGALAVTSLTLFLISPSSSPAPEKVAFACAPDLLNPGAACRFSF